MMKLISLFTVLTLSGFSAGSIAVEEQESALDYQYNGITYMSMQADDGTWMDTVWALEVTAPSNNLFNLVVAPTPKRISVKMLTSFDTQDWIDVWNRKLQAMDLNSGLEQGDYAKSFAAITEKLPQRLEAEDQFSIEIDIDRQISLILNGEERATLDAGNNFNFWMTAWISASKAGIYADGSMLAGGDIDSYLVDLLDGDVPSLDPTLVSAAF